MKRIIIWLAVSLTTFTIGVGATALFLSRSDSNGPLPAAIKHDVPAVPTVPTTAAPACFPGLSRPVDQLNPTSYFPTGAFYPQPDQEKFILEWYTKQLQAMGESSLLSQPDSPPEAYRFLWLRSFHHPVAVRVWTSCDGHFINLKQLNGQGGYEPGKLITDQTRPLTNAEWDRFVSLLDRSCYWQLPPKIDDMGLDGAQWMLEGVKEGRYHVVDRWTPQSGDFREACLYLLELSKLRIDLAGDDTY
jgi:hypothetical protein